MAIAKSSFGPAAALGASLLLGACGTNTQHMSPITGGGYGYFANGNVTIETPGPVRQMVIDCVPAFVDNIIWHPRLGRAINQGTLARTDIGFKGSPLWIDTNTINSTYHTLCLPPIHLSRIDQQPSARATNKIGLMEIEYKYWEGTADGRIAGPLIDPATGKQAWRGDGNFLPAPTIVVAHLVEENPTLAHLKEQMKSLSLSAEANVTFEGTPTPATKDDLERLAKIKDARITSIAKGYAYNPY